ncbi:histidine--tRNA ligase [bacterium]|nr:histidine--tRNA ligase [bacterium]
MGKDGQSRRPGATLSLIQKVRGTRDFFGADEALFARVESAALAAFRRYGIRQVRTPIFEETSLFTRSIGEETDIVSKEMYTFADRKGRSLSLRPEGTAPVVRFLIEEKIQITDTLKVFYLGPMFRYDRPQAGRYRQFHQFGIEYFGAASAAADAEVIAVGRSLLAKLGIESRTRLLLNSVGCPACRPAYMEKLQSFLRARSAELCEDCRGRIDANPLRCLDCKREACAKTYEESPKISSTLCDACRRHDETLKELLADAGIAFAAADRLVRGLDYYVRTVFEFVTSDLGAQDAVIAGGRYDGLVKSLGGPDVPATGFAGGIERLIELLKLNAPASDAQVSAGDVYLVSADSPELRRKAFRLTERLRSEGFSSVLPLLDGKSFKSQFRAADKSGARAVVILGEAESEKGCVSVKNMSSGEQVEIAEPDLPRLLETMGVPRS